METKVWEIVIEMVEDNALISMETIIIELYCSTTKYYGAHIQSSEMSIVYHFEKTA